MQMFDNINTFVKDDLKQEIRSGSKVSIASQPDVFGKKTGAERIPQHFRNGYLCVAIGGIVVCQPGRLRADAGT